MSLWPNLAFLPKILSPQFINQPIVLAALPADQADIRLELSPVRSLKGYIDKTAAWRKTDHLFVCFSDARSGAALSKQRLVYWVKHTYESVGQSVPSSIHCHSTCALATSWAAFRGVSFSEI